MTSNATAAQPRRAASATATVAIRAQTIRREAARARLRRNSSLFIALSFTIRDARP